MTTISLARTSAAMLAGLATLGYTQVVSAQTTGAGADAPRAAVAADPPAAAANPPAAAAAPSQPSATPAEAPAPYFEDQSLPADAAGPADAAEPADDEDKKKNRVSFSGGAGVGFGFVTHPNLVGNRFDGPILEFHLDYSLSPSWTIGLEFMNFESQVKRRGLSDTFQASDAQALHPQAGSNKDRPPFGLTGVPAGLPMNLSTLGPTVEFTPMDYDGIYLGATLGAALVHGIPFKAGGALAGRAGYRVRIADPIAAAVEGGAHAQVFDGGSAVVPFAQLQLRLLLPR